MNAAIARIPGETSAPAKWHVFSKYPSWGTTDLGSGDIYINPSVPASYLYAVAAHEWSHVKSMYDYGFHVDVAENAMMAVFGVQPATAAEYAADCMARLLGATWTNYTSCSNPAWRAAAATLLAGGQL